MSMEAGSEFVERVPREFILRMRSLGQNGPLRWITVSAVARIWEEHAPLCVILTSVYKSKIYVIKLSLIPLL